MYDTVNGEIGYSTAPTIPAKTFVIDHPNNPEKHLVHACLEGPEAGVYYRGIGEITFGDSVIVKLPDYVFAFTDFTVNLTPIGKPRILGAGKVLNGKFEVYCLPGEQCEFYWTVFGKRGTINVEPLKSSVKLNGEGPYKWIN